MTLTKMWNGQTIDIDDYSEKINIDDYIPKEA